MPPSATSRAPLPGAVDDPSPALRARRAAARAAAHAGVSVLELTEMAALTDAAALLDQVWGTNGYRAAPPELLRGLAHSGNYVSGAYRDDQLVGALVGFQGDHRDRRIVHSHILAVRSGERSRGIGAALKLHQRSWALARGHRLITWTFDPLVRRNAVFNISRLGALPAEYHLDFYGRMGDDINGGDESDRLLVVWELDSAAVRAICDEERNLHRPIAAGTAQPVVAVTDAGSPQRCDLRPDATAALIDTPADIVSLRQHQPAGARQWRTAVRHGFLACAERGMRPVGVTEAGQYVLAVDGAGLRVEGAPARD